MPLLVAVPSPSMGGSQRCVSRKSRAPCDEWVLAAAVYGYSSPAKERHRTLYTNRAYLLLTPLLIAQFKKNAQVAPTLHPPLNITSNSGPINWTVSLVCDSRNSPLNRISVDDD